MVAILDVCQGHQTYLGKRAIQELSYATPVQSGNVTLEKKIKM
jgi:hypothetical protein